MDIKINYSQELENEAKSQIDYIREEFEHLFSNRTTYSGMDKKIAADLLNYLSKLIDSASCLDYLSQNLQYLEQSFPGLF